MSPGGVGQVTVMAKKKVKIDRILIFWNFHRKIFRRKSEQCLSHNFDEHYVQDTRLIWCLSYRGGTIDPWVLRFLVVREVDCGDWLARKYMPAHKHCDLFYPLVGDLIGSAIN